MLAKTGRAQPRKLAGAFVFAGVLGASGLGALALTAQDDQTASGHLQSSTGASGNSSGKISVDPSSEDSVQSDQSSGGSHLNTSITSDGNSASVTVNGHSYDVPPNSSRHQEISTPGGTARVDISNQQSQSGSSTNFSSTYTSINSNVDVSTQTTTDESSSP